MMSLWEVDVVQVVHDWVKGLVHAQNPQEAYQLIFKSVVSLTGAESAFMALYRSNRESSGKAVIRYAHGRVSDLKHFILTLRKGMVSQVFKLKSTVVIGSYNQWPLRYPHPCLADVRTAVGVPVFCRGEVIACVGLMQHSGGKPISDKHISIVEQYVELASMILTRVGLGQSLEEERGKRKRLEATRRRQYHFRQNQESELLERSEPSIIHDLSNILTVVCAHAEMALLNQGAGNTDHLQKIVWGCGQARTLLDELRFSSNAFSGSWESMDLAGAVNDMFDLFVGSLPPNIQARKDLRAFPAWILGSSSDLQRVFLNLWTNARQAMEPNGGVLETLVEEIRLTTKEQSPFPALKPGRYFCVRVRDTGPGIPPKILERIFDPYFTTKKSTGGSGLGLVIAHNIIRSHGGHIHVESRVGAGTCVSVYLPALAQPLGVTPDNHGKTLVPHKDEVAVESSPKDFLVLVDDDPLVLEGLREVFEEAGFAVRFSKSAVEALDIVRTHGCAVQLVLLDYHLDEMDGVQLARELRSMGSSAPVVILTGDNHPAVAEAQKIGLIEASLTKPFSTKALLSLVRRIVDQTKSAQGGSHERWSSSPQRRSPCRRLLAQDNHLS